MFAVKDQSTDEATASRAARALMAVSVALAIAVNGLASPATMIRPTPRVVTGTLPVSCRHRGRELVSFKA